MKNDDSDGRNFDGVQSPQKKQQMIPNKALMPPQSIWHARRIKLGMKKTHNDKMNAMPEKGGATQVGKINFESEVLRSKQPVLAVFGAPWSKPCRVLRSVLNENMKGSDGSVKLVEVNADDNPDLSLLYNIQAIPTVLYFINGVVRSRVVGTATKRAILDKLESATRDKDTLTAPEPSQEL